MKICEIKSRKRRIYNALEFQKVEYSRTPYLNLCKLKKGNLLNFIPPIFDD
jgi:hypothetical protein